MSEDMSEIFQKMNEMLKNNEVPDSIKNMINGFNNNGVSSDSTSGNNDFSNFMNNFANSSGNANSSNSASANENDNDNGTSGIPNFDMATMLKMKSIIDNMNKTQNDPRANLLKSLKPYLKPSRKDKVDQYIKLFSMGKAFEVLNPLGGEKKNDV